MLPLLIPAIIGGVAAVAGGVAQGAGAASAAASQNDAAQRALNFQREMWRTQREDQAPWLAAGRSSLAQMLSLMNDPSSITDDPGYQFRLAEGQRALERSASARGMLSSGKALRGLTRYSQGFASEEYGNKWNRLAGLAGVGQASAQNLGALGSQTANQMGNLYGAQGNAQSAGQVGMGNAISGTLGQLGGLGMQYAMSQPQIPTQAPMSLGGPRW